MKMLHRALLAAAVLALLFGTFAYGQAGNTLRVKVPFDFTVGKDVLPAGEYIVTESDSGVITVTSVTDRKKAVVVNVITRLAMVGTAKDDARVVFDKVNDKNVLSEIWLPDKDGFLIHAERQKHTHQTVKRSRGA